MNWPLSFVSRLDPAEASKPSLWALAVDGILLDLRVSGRSLAKSPSFTAVVLLSLALGIGANTAIFTLINQVLLHELPVQHPEELVAFGNSESAGIAGGIDLGAFGGFFPWDFARQLQSDPGPFQGIAAYCSFSQEVSIRLAANGTVPIGNGSAIMVPANLVSGNYFKVLGARPFIGRTILPDDDRTPGSGAVAVLSHHFWQQSLSSDPAVLGKVIAVNGTPFEVVGVMPEDFRGIKQELRPTDLWTPISMQSTVLDSSSMLTPRSGLYFLHLFGRLRPGTVANKARLAGSQNWLNQEVRNGVRDREGTSISAERQREISRISVPLVPAAGGVSLIRSQYGESLKVLMVVVALVLLIACANLANFLLARAASRHREIVTRIALGSSRMRIVRQSLVEALLLSLVGGCIGLGVATTAAHALVAFVSQGNNYVDLSPEPDQTVLLFSLAVSLLAGLLFGLAPAFDAARTARTGTLSANTRTIQSSGGSKARFWPKTLVIAQVTLSVLLLVVAGLFLRSLENLQHQDYGFERTHLLVAEIRSGLAGYKTPQLSTLHRLLLERLSAIPGVRSAALCQTPPINDGAWSSNISLSGYTPAPKENMVSNLNRVSGQFFETAGIQIVAGRPIRSDDNASSVKVAVVSETIAKRYFPRGDAVGHLLKIEIKSVAGPWQIVGIARTTKSGNPRDTDPVRMTYIPLAQIEPFLPAAVASTGTTAKPGRRQENGDAYASTVLLRTAGDPAKTIAALRSTVAAIDPNLPLLRITTIEERVSNLISHDELISALTGVFSVLAMLLAAIGLYGVLSYTVARRTNEIGIRLALGAQTSDVTQLILGESLLLLAIGASSGLVIAWLATGFIKQQLFGLGALDPLTFLAAPSAVAGVTMLASWLPARRAAKVDPVTALRAD
ncbi:MAG TPA: ABC transporter permease [Bryobacteraceae bacterium]|jgi:predicted permease|nr:ABC transporter permease [Bryobacteraceae bacterium]